MSKMTFFFFFILRMIHNLLNSSLIFRILYMFEVFYYFKEGYVKQFGIFICSVMYLRYICWSGIIGSKNLRMFIPYKYVVKYFLERLYQFPADIVWECTLWPPQRHYLVHSLCEHILNAIAVWGQLPGRIKHSLFPQGSEVSDREEPQTHRRRTIHFGRWADFAWEEPMKVKFLLNIWG